MDKKNILFFFTDEHRKDTLGCYGNNICRTPNIDWIAREGVNFTRGYTPCAVCTPARTSVITGLMPHNHHMLANHKKNAGMPEELDEKCIPFSSYLRNAGYNTANIGKWHVGMSKGPEGYGFEGVHYPGWGETYDHPDYIKYLDEKNLPYFSVHDTIKGYMPNGEESVLGGILDQPKEGTFTYFLAERAIEKINEFAKKYKEKEIPFFLSMNMFGPHLPYYLPKEYANMYDPNDIALPEGFNETFKDKPAVQRNYSRYWCFESYSLEKWKKIIAMYWGYVTLIDEQIGRVMNVLEENGLMNDTVILFSCDHGSFEGSHRLNDKGPAMYEDIYNIPFMIRYPGLKSNGRKDNHFVSLIDLAPTFIDIASADVPENLDGKSLLPLLFNADNVEWRNEIFTEFHGHHFPYQQRMIRSDRYKLVINPADINEFYDLDNDPAELVNQYYNPSYEDIVKGHSVKLCRYLKESNDFMYDWIERMCYA